MGVGHRWDGTVRHMHTMEHIVKLKYTEFEIKHFLKSASKARGGPELIDLADVLQVIKNDTYKIGLMADKIEELEALNAQK